MASTVPKEEQVKTVTEAVTSVSKALELYNKKLDEEVPWKDFEKYPQELYRYTSEYSAEAAQLIGEIRTELQNGNDECFAMTQSIRELCEAVDSLLSAYEGDAKPADKAKILVAAFDGTVNGLKTTQAALTKTSEHFTKVSGKMGILVACLDRDFNENSDFFKKQLEKLENTSVIGAPASFGLLSASFENKDVDRAAVVAQLKQRLALVKRFHADWKTKIDSSNLVIYDAKFQTNATVPVIEEQKAQIEQFAGDLDFNADSRKPFEEALKNVADQCKTYLQKHQYIGFY